MAKVSLATLLAVILVASVGSAAVANANGFWREVMITLTIAILCGAVLLAVLRSGVTAKAAAGFACAGWLYLMLLFAPLVSMESNLVTTAASEKLAAIALPGESDYYSSATVFSMDSSLWIDGRRRAHFETICHMLFALVLASGGGLLASYLAGRNARAGSRNLRKSTAADEFPES